LAQPEHLEQGQEKTESAFQAKIYKVINGRNLKVCNLTDFLINAEWSSAEGKNGWSYNFNHPCAFVAWVWTPLFLFIYLFVYSIPKSIYSSSFNGYRNSQSVTKNNLLYITESLSLRYIT